MNAVLDPVRTGRARADAGDPDRNEVEKHVKPAWFDYYAPRALDEALRILGDAGPDGRVLAGGQSLMPMLNLRILSPAVIVDINRIEALNRLQRRTGQPDGRRAGPARRSAAQSPTCAQGWPLLAEATTQVAHMAIRNRGTVCGSVSPQRSGGGAAERAGHDGRHGGDRRRRGPPRDARGGILHRHAVERAGAGRDGGGSALPASAGRHRHRRSWSSRAGSATSPSPARRPR